MMDFFYDIFGIYGPEFIGPTTLPYSILVALLKLSLPACVLIAAVLLARLLLRKAPKWISCVLWALVALRLVCPFTIESPFSVMPKDLESGKAVDAWMDSYVPGGYTVIYEGEPGYKEAVGSDKLPVQSKDGTNYVVTGVGVSSVPETVGRRILPQLFYAWVIGLTAMLLYAAVSYFRLKRRTAVTVPCAEGVWTCDEIDSPFILGVFRPRIYLPSRMTEPQLSRVLAHEKAHLKRHDHWWKPLGFLLLSVYWFNPLVWIAYILLCRDIEMACDERVVRDLDTAERADYAQALLDCSRSRRGIAACPLAFGEVGVKERVKGILNYKKPAFWIILIAMIACVVLAICLLTAPSSTKSLSGKLGVSMDMAVAEHNRSPYAEGHFIATDYDVLLISESRSETTVYAWVLYQEYSFDGRDVQFERGSHIPTAITFDTSANDNDSAAYDVIEYWEPRDGSCYADDIRAKFPRSIRENALDITKSKASSENCLRAAREYFGVDESKLLDAVFGKYYTVQEIKYEGKRSGGNTSIPLSGYCVSGNGELWILEDLNSNNWLRAGTCTELVLSKDTFDQYFDPDGKTLAANLRGNNAKAWRVLVSDLPDSLFYYLLLQKDGEVCLTRGYYDAGEKDDPNSDDTRIPYVFLLKETDKHSEAEIDMESLKAKYPEYFDLDTFKGLEVYVWQIVPGSYSCGVMSGTNRNKTLEELMNLKGATIAEMRAILSTYDIAEENVSVIPWQNPVSSYIAEYWISQEGEDSAAAEQRKQAYVEGIRQMLFGGAQSGSLDLPNPIVEIKTAVAYANWTEDSRVFADCSNAGMMIISSVPHHLPVYKLDTLKDLEQFKEKFRDILTLDHGYDEVPSFNDITALYDDSFFADHTLVLAYVTAPSGSFRYAIQDISYGGSAFCLDVVQTNDPETHTDDMAGWFVIAEVLDSDIADYILFDAQLVERE